MTSSYNLCTIRSIALPFHCLAIFEVDPNCFKYISDGDKSSKAPCSESTPSNNDGKAKI